MSEGPEEHSREAGGNKPASGSKPVYWIKLLIAVAALAALYGAFRYFDIDFSRISKEQMKQKVLSFGIWGPVLYIAIYLLRPLILFPAGILSASAGFIWGVKTGFLYLQIAANISSTAEFFIARYFGRGAISRLIKGKMLDLDERMERHGFLTVLLVRLIPNVAWDIQNFSLGLTRVKFRDYFFATLLGIMPGSFAFVFLGASLIETLTNPRYFWMIIVATLLFAGVFAFQKWLRKRNAGSIGSAGGGEKGERDERLSQGR